MALGNRNQVFQASRPLQEERPKKLAVEPSLNPLPFLIVDFTLLATALLLVNASARPLSLGSAALVTICVGAGGLIALYPYAQGFRARQRLQEIDNVGDTLDRLDSLNTIVERVERVGAQWRNAQETNEAVSKQCNDAAALLFEESKTIREFAQKQNDQQKANLRLEIQKLRQGEAEWIQAATLMLDHTAALHGAISDSGDETAIRRLDKFQNSAHEIMRRVGLVGFAPRPGAPFDPDANKVADRADTPPDGSRIKAVVAMGIRYQGRVLRPALVQVHPPGTDEGREPPIEPELFPENDGVESTATSNS